MADPSVAAGELVGDKGREALVKGKVDVGGADGKGRVPEGMIDEERVVVFPEPGPTRKKFPATGSLKDVLAANSVMLKFILKDSSAPVVPLKKEGAVVLKSSGWT